jgi:hypothetical protein
MNLVRKFVSLKAATLFFAGFLTVPMAAQQEVAPEHFDQKPRAAKSRKPSPQARKATNGKSTQSASNQGSSAVKSKKKVQASTALGTPTTTASIQR